MKRLAARLFAAAVCALSAAAPAAAAGPFADWAAVFVAGDFRSHDGGATEAFDNARRDMAAAFVAAGFSPANIAQFSVRPDRYADTRPMPSDLPQIVSELNRLATQAKGGCLVYFTSHGSPQGALVGDGIMAPRTAARLVGQACGERPTVVVISACYSGVFIPFLEGANRMVLTAARPDRSSFGCSESDKYPYFDACLLESLPGAPDFPALGRAAQLCVGKREAEARLAPASEPQMSVGGEMRPILPLLAFAKPVQQP